MDTQNLSAPGAPQITMPDLCRDDYRQDTDGPVPFAPWRGPAATVGRPRPVPQKRAEA
ncbi:hypothetical protein [Kitasatospora sp. NPDC059571]|uniref:hypothetical protein n=1 Tax=Kitasatospora sp. NPDC059571 TaxID=3346871 RepID=UPI003678C532